MTPRRLPASCSRNTPTARPCASPTPCSLRSPATRSCAAQWRRLSAPRCPIPRSCLPALAASPCSRTWATMPTSAARSARRTRSASMPCWSRPHATTRCSVVPAARARARCCRCRGRASARSANGPPRASRCCMRPGSRWRRSHSRTARLRWATHGLPSASA